MQERALGRILTGEGAPNINAIQRLVRFMTPHASLYFMHAMHFKEKRKEKKRKEKGDVNSFLQTI